MITNLRQSLPVAIDSIKTNTLESPYDVKLINNDNHMLITTHKNVNYLLLFKRDFFHSFGAIFNLKGVGESINKEYLDDAIEQGIERFIFVYSNGHVYTITPLEFKTYAETNNTIRTTESGEVTLSVSLNCLKRW